MRILGFEICWFFPRAPRALPPAALHAGPRALAAATARRDADATRAWLRSRERARQRARSGRREGGAE